MKQPASSVAFDEKTGLVTMDAATMMILWNAAAGFVIQNSDGKTPKVLAFRKLDDKTMGAQLAASARTLAFTMPTLELVVEHMAKTTGTEEDIKINMAKIEEAKRACKEQNIRPWGRGE